LAAVMKSRRPRIRRARLLGPSLALERSQHSPMRSRNSSSIGSKSLANLKTWRHWQKSAMRAAFLS
jgi:hypothetical protein